VRRRSRRRSRSAWRSCSAPQRNIGTPSVCASVADVEREACGALHAVDHNG
jgi:hypothetical protein